MNTASPAHSHTLTVPSSTTSSAAPAAGGQIAMQDSQPEDAQQAHENRMPYYVVNYIMKVA